MTQLATSHPDQELIAAVRRGSDLAFEELYSRYSARIRAYVLSTMRDHARAEDVTQEVFISALRGLRGSEGGIAFKPWIYGIAKNACIDESRRTRRRGHEVPLEGDPSDALTSSRWLLAVPSPEVAVDEKQQLSDLRSAFGVLSPNHHRVIVMRELEGLSYRQIGERLGMSQPVVESTLFRARRQLGAEFDELRSGRRCGSVQTEIARVQSTSWKSLGVRRRRKLTRHLADCEPCRRVARQAGLDESFFRAPTLPAKIAALLPLLPWLRGRRGAAGPDTSVTGSLPLAARPLGARALQAIHALGDPSGPLGGIGREAVAAVTTAAVLVGTGTGLVGGVGGVLSAPRNPHPPVAAVGGYSHPGSTPARARPLLAAPSSRGGASSTRAREAIGLSPRRPSAGTARPYVHRAGGHRSPGGPPAPGGPTRAGSLAGSANDGNVVTVVAGNGLLSSGGGSAMDKVGSLSPRANVPGLPALPRLPAGLP
ncbi:MAG: sigma-70 family RNA polymerase sigma factor, partial [Actinomycetota bacterium]|nr:sigma-70 family RNA polymerase sigma factor [Actinomycetota bacterium]